MTSKKTIIFSIHEEGQEKSKEVPIVYYGDLDLKSIINTLYGTSYTSDDVVFEDEESGARIVLNDKLPDQIKIKTTLINTTICSVCVTAINKRSEIILKCEHKLHVACWQQCLDKHVNQCPECRKPLRVAKADDTMEVVKMNANANADNGIDADKTTTDENIDREDTLAAVASHDAMNHDSAMNRDSAFNDDSDEEVESPNLNDRSLNNALVSLLMGSLLSNGYNGGNSSNGISNSYTGGGYGQTFSGNDGYNGGYNGGYTNNRTFSQLLSLTRHQASTNDPPMLNWEVNPTYACSFSDGDNIIKKHAHPYDVQENTVYRTNVEESGCMWIIATDAPFTSGKHQIKLTWNEQQYYTAAGIMDETEHSKHLTEDYGTDFHRYSKVHCLLAKTVLFYIDMDAKTCRIEFIDKEKNVIVQNYTALPSKIWIACTMKTNSGGDGTTTPTTTTTSARIGRF